MTLKPLCLLILLGLMVYQVSSAEYEARSTNTLNIDLSLNLTANSSVSLTSGADINFWIKDETNSVHNFPFFTAFGILTLTLTHDASHVCTIAATYNAVTISQTIYTSSTNNWLNVQILAKSGEQMDVFIWDFQNFQLEPVGIYQFTSHMAFVNTNLVIHPTSLPEGVLFAELRSYSLASTICYGRYYYLHIISTSYPSTLIKYTRTTNGSFFLEANDANASSIALSTVVAFDVTLCSEGEKISTTAGQCVSCSSTGCLYCELVDSLYTDLCRSCNQSISSCIESTVCPVDYYHYNGVCLRCPIGCSHCTSATQCTFCDTGLVLETASDGSKQCNCNSGHYPTIHSSNDTKSCTACTSPCAECQNAHDNCTSCITNYFLQSDSCLADCGTGNFGDTATGTCKGCGVNCDVCVDENTCTTCTGVKVIADGACVDSCPTNSLLSGTTCNNCTSGCETCSTVTTNCTSCVSGFYLENNLCQTSCQDGYYGDNTLNVCAQCDAAECQKCLSLDTCLQCVASLVLINYKCESSCTTGYYEDQYAVDDRVCKNCPVTCYQCDNMQKCTNCHNGLYRWTIDVNTVTCVQECPPGMFETNSGGTDICDNCMTDCLECSSSTTCDYCIIGKVSQPINSTDDQCQDQCNQTYYEDENGKCQTCPTNCNVCSGPYECTSCSTGYSLNDTECVLDALCTGKYFITAGFCNKCRDECATCTSTNICTSCEPGYSLSGTSCNSNCGNSQRDEFEQCDDGNIFDDDGCSSTCQTESNYKCLYSNNSSPDICYCDPGLISARWLDDWKELRIEFSNEVKVNTTALSSPSSDPHTFCTQILASSMVSSIGSTTECRLFKDESGYYVFSMEFSSDATFGSTQPSTLTFNNYLQTNNGCPIGIPLTYHLLSLPIVEPYIQFRQSSSNVPLCSESFLLDIFASKGFTARDITSINWEVISIDSVPGTSEVTSLNSTVSSSFSNKKYIELDSTTVSSLAGKAVEFKVTVTNFLGKSSNSTTLINFLSSKRIILDGLYSTYTLLDNQDQKLFLTGSIPYCSGNDRAAILSQERSITINCELYMDDGTTLVTSLTDCKITAGTMSYPNSYKLKVSAANPSDTSQNVDSWSDIHIKKSDYSVFIHGGDRSISVNESNSFTASVTPTATTLIYKWSCIDELSNTYCRYNNSYIMFPDSPNMTINANYLTENRSYKISLLVEDVGNNREGVHHSTIHTTTGNIVHVEIDSRHNKNGYINPSKTSLFVALGSYNNSAIKVDQASYTWVIMDSLNNTVDLSNSRRVYNSLKLSSGTLIEDETYTVQVSVSYSGANGTASIVYDTIIDTNYTLEIAPSSGVALSTDFYVTAISHSSDYELVNFAFGYYKDGSKYLITRSSPSPSHVVKLPQGGSNNALTLFCQLTTKEGKEFILHSSPTTITVSAPTISAGDFETMISSTLSDSINESVKLRMIYEHLRSSLSSSVKQSAVELMFDGLQRDGSVLKLDQDEPTSMTVAQTLKIISEDLNSIGSSSLLTRSFDIFQQMTISENTQTSSYYVVEFSQDTFYNLYKYADNVLGSLSLVDDTTKANIKQQVQIGIQNALRGSIIDEATGDSAYTHEGTNLSIIALRVTSNGFNGSVSMAPSRLRRQLQSEVSRIEVPGSALPSTNYAQVTVVTTTEPSYSINLNNSNGVLRSGMARVTIEENDPSMSEIGSKVYSKPVTISNLVNPITIKMPYSGSVDDKRTISCGFINSGTIDFTDITSTLNTNDNTVTCLTKHLTDFVLEEHDDNSIEENLVYPDNSVPKLMVYKAFAFWISLILFAALYPLIRIAKNKDNYESKDPTNKWKLRKNKINVFNTFWNQIPERPNLEEDAVPEELPSRMDNTRELDATSHPMNDNNVTTYMAPRMSMNSIHHSRNMDETDQKLSETSNKLSEPSHHENDANEPDGEVRTQKLPPEEEKQPAIIDNIFDNTKQADMEKELNNDQKDEIMLHIRKRKGKKKKNKANKDENTEISLKSNQEKPPEEPVKFDTKFEKQTKKEFKFDALDDYEGGEGDAEDVSDKIQPYDIDHFDDISHQENENNQGFNDNIDFKPKKRKKKMMKKKKKPKKFDETDPNNLTPAPDKPNIDSFLMPQKEQSSPKSSRSRQSININETNEENLINGAKILDGKDLDALQDSDPEPSVTNDGDNTAASKEPEQKTKRRFYNAKFYLRALYLGHRYTNFYSSYNEQIPRLWRLLIFYNQMFIIMLLCGVVFYNPGPTRDTDSLDGYTSFFYAIIIIGVDRLMNMGIIYLILRYRQYETRSDSYLQDETVHDYTINGITINDDTINKNEDAENDNRLGLENKPRTDDKADGVVMGKGNNKVQQNINDPMIKQQKKDKRILWAIILITAFILLFCFAFTIVMGIRFSNHSGYVWMVAILDVWFFGHVCLEPLVLFGTGLLIHRKMWERPDLH